MRHRKAGYKLGRTTAHRRSTLRNLAAGLFEHGQITTTIPRAKAMQPYVEKIITLAKRGDIHSRRLVAARLRDRVMADDEDKVERNRYGELKRGPKLVKHIFEEVAPRFQDRAGGYTRIVKLGVKRLGDKGELCVIQFVGDEDGPEIGGRPSTRRRTADRRTAYYAKVRKAGESKAKPKAEAAPAEPETPASGE
ncbi:MAG: 50S ribosomal protein L17 [Phycisphaerales bacterium]|nr:MAG: 50S ribosomal protein L17 [Phycisphaerales bacterium]